MDRNKIRSGDKIQNGGDRKVFMLTSCLVIQPLAIGILGIIGCFVAIISARPPCQQSLPNHGTLIVF